MEVPAAVVPLVKVKRKIRVVRMAKSDRDVISFPVAVAVIDSMS